jgi:polyhydroxybutyrate depolymerase
MAAGVHRSVTRPKRAERIAAMSARLLRLLARFRTVNAMILHSLAAALLLALPAWADPEEVRLGGRFYLIDLPDRSDGAPILLALHGGGGDPAQFAGASGLGEAATARGYAVIFPAGTSRRGADRLLTWNGGYCCGYAARAGIDDIGFLKDVIADAAARFGLDGGAVFVTGMSNGAILAETFAARNPTLVRAVAGVAGTMDVTRTRVRGPVPALIIHGTADAMVPYGGGRGEDGLTDTDFAAVDQVVQAFLAVQPGTLSLTVRRLDAKDDGTSVTITDWGKGGSIRLRLVTIEGGAHHWPGGRKARLREGKTREIDANSEILRFFDLFR